MSALPGYVTDATAYWAWAAGMIMGAFGGTLLGQWMERVLSRNPLGGLIRAYRELWADILHLCATGQLRPGR